MIKTDELDNPSAHLRPELIRSLATKEQLSGADELTVLKGSWIECERCPLGKIANEHNGKHVLYEITGPFQISPSGRANTSDYPPFVDKGYADLLFIGEGPGASENSLGRPFIGRAGRLLRGTVEQAYGIARGQTNMASEQLAPGTGPNDFIVAYSNLVACRPCDKHTGPNRAPLENEVSACSPRLLSVIHSLYPTGIVLCGKVPQAYWDTHIQAKALSSLYYPFIARIPHPAYILRQGGEAAPYYEKYVASITGAINTCLLLGGGR